MSRLVYGIGVNDNKYPARKNSKNLKEYETWKGMLRRCTKEYWSKFPTYIGTTCSENFKQYSYFYEWYQTQLNASKIDEDNNVWCLDKDLLIKGNKLYSEDTCVFIPHRINSLLTKRDKDRGGNPIGVYWSKSQSKYKSQCSCGKGERKHLGYFSTPQEAFLSYKTFKELFIKQVANEYKHQIDDRSYAALIAYEVNEND